ncbi:hypothetical protein LEA_06912, partial [human gut metagenome]
HGGNNFSYIRAMRQIGEETGTPVLDLFSYSVELFEKSDMTISTDILQSKKVSIKENGLTIS